MNRLIITISIVLLSGCTETQIQESMLGLKKNDYIEPDINTAKITFKAPMLKKIMWAHDEVEVSIYDKCNNNNYRSEGYIGGFKLSSDPAFGKEKTISVRANEELFFEFGYEMGVECTNKFKMKAQDGDIFDISYRYEMGKCYADVNEITDNEERIKTTKIKQNSTKGNSMFSTGWVRTDWRSCDTEWK